MLISQRQFFPYASFWQVGLLDVVFQNILTNPTVSLFYYVTLLNRIEIKLK